MRSSGMSGPEDQGWPVVSISQCGGVIMIWGQIGTACSRGEANRNNGQHVPNILGKRSGDSCLPMQSKPKVPCPVMNQPPLLLVGARPSLGCRLSPEGFVWHSSNL